MSQRFWFIGLTLMMLMAAGCGPQEPATTGDVVQAGTDSSLEAAARAEGGELMVYTSMNIDNLEQLLARFEAAYPFVTAEYYRASGDDVIQRALIESQGGRQFADVYETQAFEIYRLKEVGLLQPFVPPQSSAYPDSVKEAEGYWTVDRINTVVIAYNTDLVAAADAPTDWQDLLDPRWKGLMGVEASDVELLANMIGVWGAEPTYTFWEGIAAQEPGLVDGHTALAELVAAGEFAVSPTLYGPRVEKMIAAGAPLAWVRADPVIAYTSLVALAAEAPHPATARLYIDWLLSEDGQIAIRDVSYIPARPGVAADPPRLTENINIIHSSPSLAADYDQYLERWNRILGLND